LHSGAFTECVAAATVPPSGPFWARETLEVTDMALINRISRLLSADIHAVLDRIEEPEALLRQAVREMEERIARAEEQARRLELERHGLGARRRKLAVSLTELDTQLGVAFDSGNEALARRIVRRKLETEKIGERLTERVEALENDIDRRQSSLAEQRERLDVLRQRAEVLTGALEPSASPPDDDPGRDLAVSEDEVEVAFLRERQRRRPS
jgi:chromosome segregation ATPase